MPIRHGPNALAGAIGAEESIAGQRRDPDSTNRRPGPKHAQALRRQRHIEQLHRLGPRVLAELLAEIERHHPEIVDDIDRRLARYAELDPEILRALGGDRFPPRIWAIGR